MHTCPISYCEIKSHRIWPIWKAIPIKNSNLTEFSDHFKTDFMKKSHTVVVFTSFLHGKKKKDFRLYWGSSKVMFKKISQNFVQSSLKFCLISQILVHSLWHVCTCAFLLQFLFVLFIQFTLVCYSVVVLCVLFRSLCTMSVALPGYPHIYCIELNYCTYPYNRTVKQFCSLQITTSVFLSILLYKSICCWYSFELPQQVEAFQMSTHNICI